jgi:predicted ATPase
VDLAHFRERLHSYLALADKNQQSLAALLHIHPNGLSRKLNHTNNATFNRSEVTQLIRILAEWRCFSWRTEIDQLLEMLDFKAKGFFSENEWQLPPFNTIEQNPPPTASLENLPGEIEPAGKFSNKSAPVAPLKTAPVVARIPDNLPPSFSSFVGRKREINEVAELLTSPNSPRLLTLTGAGGSGKTRLALAVAEKLREGSRFGGGIYFIALETITNRPELLNHLVITLKLKDLPGTTQLETLKTYLADRPRLLVLDNFEQVVEAGPLLVELLKSSVGSKLLVTSRVPLQLSLEREYQVSPLSLPSDEEIEILKKNESENENKNKNETETDGLKGYSAVALFCLRAQAARPDFALNAGNRAAVVEICRRLDGLPLALELAAARVRTFTPQNLLERLSLKLLSGGPRDLPPRQQTLRGTLDWSYNLLSAQEQTLFTRLSIFGGGFTLEAAEAVCNPGGEFDLGIETYEGIESLLLKNLLISHQYHNGSNRFGMLQTILEYGQEKLLERGENNRIAQYYSAYFVKLARRIELEFKGGNQYAALGVFDNEYANLRNVLSKALNQVPAATGIILGLAASLGDFWNYRGYLQEGRRYLEQALALTGENDDPEVNSNRARVLNTLGALAVRQGDHQIARSYFEASLPLSRNLEDKSEMAFSLSKLNDLAGDQGDFALALGYLEEIMGVAHECSDKRVIVATLHDLGFYYFVPTEDYARSRQYLEESLALALKIGDKRGATFALNSLGHLVAYFEDDNTTALRYVEQGMAASREIGDTRGIWWSLLSLGILAFRQQEFDRAKGHIEASLAVAREIGDRRSIYYSLQGLARTFWGLGENDKAQQNLAESEVLSQELGPILNFDKVYLKRPLL